MKIKKSEFKALIKECLVEILQEGLGGSALSAKSPVVSAVVKKGGFPFGSQAEPEEVDADDVEPSEDEEGSDFPPSDDEESDETADEETSEEEEESTEEEEESEEPQDFQEAHWFSRKKKLVKETVQPAPRKPAPKAPAPVKRNQRLEELTRQVAGSIKGNSKMKSMFEDIFRDTANTTLHEQTQRASVAKAQGEYGMHNVIDANPEEIFEGADRWANLAFTPASSITGKVKFK